jgi:hypothetical protein
MVQIHAFRKKNKGKNPDVVIVKMYAKTLSKIIKTHDQQSSNTMVKHRQKPWSTIDKNDGQQSKNTMFTHRQKPWSQFDKNDGQTLGNYRNIQ